MRAYIQCDMNSDCPYPATYLGDRGFIYCTEHAPCRQGFERTRKLKRWELQYLREGKQLPSYKPVPKP